MYDFEEYGDLTQMFRPPPKSNHVIGESVPAPPLAGATQTFISCILKTEEECINCNKYINTKFVKALLSVLKVTQHNPPQTWKYVPLQDFTNDSDIDWSKSIAEIDKQLYQKYEIEPAEIDWIEEHFSYHPRFEENDAFVRKYGVKNFFERYRKKCLIL